MVKEGTINSLPIPTVGKIHIKVQTNVSKIAQSEPVAKMDNEWGENLQFLPLP